MLPRSPTVTPSLPRVTIAILELLVEHSHRRFGIIRAGQKLSILETREDNVRAGKGASSPLDSDILNETR